MAQLNALIATNWGPQNPHVTVGFHVNLTQVTVCCGLLVLGGLFGLMVNQLFIIIIMLHGYPWPSLATPSYHSLLLVGLQSYIPYWRRAIVHRFKLVVLPLLGHVKGSTGVHHLWAHSYFSSSVPHVWFV